MKLPAKILSVLFHPLLLPSYAIAIVIISNPYLFAGYGQHGEWVFLIRAFLNTFAFPVFSIVLLKQLGFVKSFQMEVREERIIPYIATGTFYIWTYVSFRRSSDPQIINIILLGSCITLFGCFFANLIGKISIHAAGIGCFAAIILYNCVISNYDLRWMLLIVVLLSGIIGSSRLFLKSHGIREVYAGYLVGVTAQMVAMHFM
jgi:hypothetical protein